MNSNIDVTNISISDVEVLELLEHSLQLDYEHSYVQNGVIYHNARNNHDVCTAIKTDIPEEVYSAYVTIRKYLLKEG